MLQQQLANLQTNFQQISALWAALGASTNLNSRTMNSGIPFNLPMVLEGRHKFECPPIRYQDPDQREHIWKGENSLLRSQLIKQ